MVALLFYIRVTEQALKLYLIVWKDTSVQKHRKDLWRRGFGIWFVRKIYCILSSLNMYTPGIRMEYVGSVH
jgi:hypothetical protein